MKKNYATLVMALFSATLAFGQRFYDFISYSQRYKRLKTSFCICLLCGSILTIGACKKSTIYNTPQQIKEELTSEQSDFLNTLKLALVQINKDNSHSNKFKTNNTPYHQFGVNFQTSLIETINNKQYVRETILSQFPSDFLEAMSSKSYDSWLTTTVIDSALLIHNMRFMGENQAFDDLIKTVSGDYTIPLFSKEIVNVIFSSIHDADSDNDRLSMYRKVEFLLTETTLLLAEDKHELLKGVEIGRRICELYVDDSKRPPSWKDCAMVGVSFVSAFLGGPIGAILAIGSMAYSAGDCQDYLNS